MFLVPQFKNKRFPPHNSRASYLTWIFLILDDSFFLVYQSHYLRFHLSWTTLSTVGYGVIAPRVPMEPGQLRCIGINFLMAVEAFIGVLFSGTFLIVCISIIILKTRILTFNVPLFVWSPN